MLNGKDIIDKILFELEIKAPTFATNIGVPYQRIFDIQRGKTKKISGDLASAIFTKYPQFSIDWLLKGNMLNSEKKGILPPIDKNSLIETGAEVFSNKLIELFQKGEIFPASVVTEKDAKISELNREIGRLEARIKELEFQKSNVHPEDNAGCAVAK